MWAIGLQPKPRRRAKQPRHKATARHPPYDLFYVLTRALRTRESCRDATQLGDGQPTAPAARPRTTLSRHHAAEKWPACSPASRPGLVWPGHQAAGNCLSLATALRFGLAWSGHQAAGNCLSLATASRPGLDLPGREAFGRWQSIYRWRHRLGSSFRDDRQLRDRHRCAAAPPGLVLPGQQAAERWPALCHC